MDFADIFVWIVGLSPVWGTFLWCLWQGIIRPHIIARQAIVTEAGRLWAQDRTCALKPSLR